MARPRKPVPPTPAEIAGLPHDEYLRRKIVFLESWLLTPDATRNGAALVQGVRLAAALKAELAGLEADDKPGEGVDPATLLSDDELLTGIALAIAGLPDAALDLVEAALHARRHGRPNLRVM